MTAETQAPSLVPALFGSRTQPWTPGMPTPNLNKALSLLQGKLPVIPKGKHVKVDGKEGRRGYEYDYAELSDVAQTVGPLLGEFGLAFYSAVTVSPADPRQMILAWSLLHESGEERSGIWPLGPVGTSAQSVGSAITYGRRYCLGAATGAVTEDDDDGQRAQEIKHQSAGDAWDGASRQRPERNRGQRDRGQGDGPQVDKVAQALAKLALQLASDTSKTVGDLNERVEKQAAGKEKLDAPVENPFGDSIVKLREVLREARRRMEADPGKDGQGQAGDQVGSGQDTDEAAAAQAGADDAEAEYAREFMAALAAITDPDKIGAKRAEIGPAVKGRIISTATAGELTAACTAHRRALEEAGAQ